MMISVRIALINLALTQSRGVMKLMLALQTSSTKNEERTLKEMLSLIDSLASTLNSKRHYIRQSIKGFEIDPRYLLFEYCHGLLLRQSQVELIEKLMRTMEKGQSICHQVSL